MKKNIEIKDLSNEQIQMIEELCKKINLENLDMDEKIAFAHAFDKNFNKIIASELLPNYPFIHLSGGATLGTKQDMHTLLLLFILHKSLASISNQSTLIEQNKKIIELLTKISDK